MYIQIIKKINKDKNERHSEYQKLIQNQIFNKNKSRKHACVSTGNRLRAPV